MTCIVGYLEKGRVYIGADSQGSNDFIKFERKDPKVFIKDEMIFGFCGSFRMGQLLRYSLDIPKHPEGMDDYEYMCTSFISSVAEVLEKNRLSKIEDNVAEIPDSEFIVGYNGTLYLVSTDFQIAMFKNKYVATGSGYEYAFGSLHSTEKLKIPVQEKIKIAIEAAIKYNPFVGGQIIIKSI